jgi:carbon monoxide dehydrogenase subunit G
MKIEGEHLFNGPREEVWLLFRDPDILASALPGTQDINKISDTEFDITMNVRVGPVSGIFTGKLVISNEVPPESCTLTADGRGGPGFVKGVGNVKFADQGDATTLLKYDGEFQIGGTIASVGQRMIDSVAKSMIRQGFEVFDKALEARLADKAGQKVDFKPPSETEFAAAVAKDVAKSWTQIAEVRMLMYVIPVGIVLAILGLLLSQCTAG